MGLSLDTLHVRGASIEDALQCAVEALRKEGWSVVERRGPLTRTLGAASAAGWVSISLPKGATSKLVPRIIQASGRPGIHLYVADSDFWGGTLFAAGAVVRRFDTRKRPPAARTLRRQIAATLALEVAEGDLAAALTFRPTFAEEALDGFAQLLALEHALLRPTDAATTVLLEPPISAMDAELAGTLDIHALSLVLAPRVGFGRAAMALLEYMAQKLNGGELGPRNIAVDAGAIERFTRSDLPALAARLDAGGISQLDASFQPDAGRYGGAYFSCMRYGLQGRSVQIRAPGLLSVEGQLAYPDPLGLLDPPAELLERFFVATQTTVGLIEPISSYHELASADLHSMVAWPPVAHWVRYLEPALARQLDQPSIQRAAAEGWQLGPTPDGALLARMKLPAHESRSTAGVAARAALTQVLSGLLPPPRA